MEKTTWIYTVYNYIMLRIQVFKLDNRKLTHNEDKVQYKH